VAPTTTPAAPIARKAKALQFTGFVLYGSFELSAERLGLAQPRSIEPRLNNDIHPKISKTNRPRSRAALYTHI
jgi:hypothetical protein